MTPFALSRPFPAHGGVPVLTHVSPEIFVRRYVQPCMECTFCNDACCEHGVDVDAPNVTRILEHAIPLETILGTPRSSWFETGFRDDPEFPSGRHTRTRVMNDRCVFRARGRGCALHAYCLERGIDYHELKPMVSSLFPLTFDDGLLHPATEVRTRSLVCLDERGTTLYRAARPELEHYFGAELVRELDQPVRAKTLA